MSGRMWRAVGMGLALGGLFLGACDGPGGSGETTDTGNIPNPGSGQTFTPGSGKSSYTMDDICPAFAQALCFQQACQLRESVSNDCISTFQAVCQTALLAPIQGAVAAGEATFDGALVAKCFNQMKLVCTPDGDVEGFDGGDECDTILAGKRTAGEACSYSVSCAPGHFCQPGEGDTCPGTCMARPQEGEPCDWETLSCDTGLSCSFEFGEETGTCKKSLEDQPIGADCEFSSDCVDGAFCNTEQKCAAPLGEGEVCGGGQQCAEDLYCSFAELEPVCTKRIAAGGACTTTDSCEVNHECRCPDETPECGTEGQQCLSRLKEAGDACDPDNWSDCGYSGMYCHATNKVCTRQPRAGDECGEAAGTTDCLWSWCNTATSKCQAFVPVGGQCDGQGCMLGSACVDGTCTAPPATCTSEFNL